MRDRTRRIERLPRLDQLHLLHSVRRQDGDLVSLQPEFHRRAPVMVRAGSRSRSVPAMRAVRLLAARGPTRLSLPACRSSHCTATTPLRAGSTTRSGATRSRHRCCFRARSASASSGSRSGSASASSAPAPSRARAAHCQHCRYALAGTHPGHSLVLPAAAAQGLGSVPRGRRGRFPRGDRRPDEDRRRIAPPPPEDAILIATIRAMVALGGARAGPRRAEGLRARRRRPARGARGLRVRRRRVPQAARGAADERDHHPHVERAGRAHSRRSARASSPFGCRRSAPRRPMPCSPSRRCARRSPRPASRARRTSSAASPPVRPGRSSARAEWADALARAQRMLDAAGNRDRREQMRVALGQGGAQGARRVQHVARRADDPPPRARARRRSSVGTRTAPRAAARALDDVEQAKERATGQREPSADHERAASAAGGPILR